MPEPDVLDRQLLGVLVSRALKLRRSFKTKLGVHEYPESQSGRAYDSKQRKEMAPCVGSGWYSDGLALH